MDEFGTMAAANILATVDGVNDPKPVKKQEAFVVDLSNPVCPCCGAKLVINDPTVADENEELNVDALQESYVDGKTIMPLVHEIAQSIIDAYMESADDAEETDLVYIEKRELLSAIHRKAIELGSILRNNYGLEISVHELELSIRKEIQLILQYYK